MIFVTVDVESTEINGLLLERLNCFLKIIKFSFSYKKN